jgi:hypothetical protein
MYLCVRVSILPFSTILTFDFGIVPEVWYFLFYSHVSVVRMVPKWYNTIISQDESTSVVYTVFEGRLVETDSIL